MLGFVEFVEVSCFVGGDEGFRRAFDSLYVPMSTMSMRSASNLSRSSCLGGHFRDSLSVFI